MKKIFAMILASLMVLTACGSNKRPYEKTIEKYITSSESGQQIPEDYQEIAAGLIEHAKRDLSIDGEFLYKWTFEDPDDNLLGIGGITLSIVVNDVEHTYIFMTSKGE